jgi:hypothetical protein
LKIRYSDFWIGFDPEKFVLTHLIMKNTGEHPEIVKNPEEIVDIEIFSSFPFSSSFDKLVGRIKFNFSQHAKNQYISKATYGFRENYPNKARIKIWFSGENRRPPKYPFDLVLSFERTDDAENRLYFPYWMTRINWGHTQGVYEIFPTAEDLSTNRRLSPKKKSVCVFSSNLEPNRQRIIDATERVVEVSKFGSAYRRRVNSKFETSAEYSMQICNENDLYPGYVTEKLQESWVAGNVPIWSGIFPSDHCFNTNALIDVTGLTLDQITARIAAIDTEEIVYRLNEPLHSKLVSIVTLEEALQKLL